VQNCCVCGFR
jgi:hypothetical protein